MYELVLTFRDGKTGKMRESSLHRSVASFFDENGLLYSLNSQLGKTIISRKTASENERITEMAALDEERTITGYDNGLVRIWKKNSHVTIDLFADGLNIDNIFVMRDGRIITFAETKGKIWRI